MRPDRPPDDFFSLDRDNSRFSRAFVVSLVSHVLFFLLFMALVTYGPSHMSNPLVEQLRNYRLTWLATPGPGGGGGGGGNRSPDPPRAAEAPGKDAITVPVQKPPSTAPPKKQEPEQPPIDSLTIPAMAQASGLQSLPGVIEDGVPNVTSQGSGSGGGAGTGRGTGVGEGDGSGLGPGSGGGTGGGVYRPGSGITTPRPIREVKPQYTSEAMRAKIQGEVWLECVVFPDGSVGATSIVRSLDAVFGLDQEAIKAAKQWRFVPGTRQGQAVPVMVTISMTFTLR